MELFINMRPEQHQVLLRGPDRYLDELSKNGANISEIKRK